jgi:pimeloyl-ACP methyl ester carboxylesterase
MPKTFRNLWLVGAGIAGIACIAGIALLATACFRPQPATVPLRVLDLPGGGGDSSCLVVFLPGRGDRPEDYLRQDFPGALRKAGSRCQTIGVDSHLGYFAERSITQRLREDVIAPAKARGVEEIWLVGISLGGLGSVLYARDYPEDVDGLVLLAPYLGDKAVIEEVAGAGGLRSWKLPQGTPEADLRRAWAWLQGYAEPGSDRPELYLAFGASDRFARANGLLGEVLPRERVFTLPGGHNWRTWKRLWQAFLDSGQVPGRQ